MVVIGIPERPAAPFVTASSCSRPTLTIDEQRERGEAGGEPVSRISGTTTTSRDGRRDDAADERRATRLEVRCARKPGRSGRRNGFWSAGDHEQAAGVRADRHEADVAEREDPRVADEDVEPDDERSG